MKSITRKNGKYYECDSSNNLKFVAGNEYYIPIVIPFYAKNLKEINAFDEKDYLIEVCKSIDVMEAMEGILTNELGYSDVYSGDGSTYIKRSYLLDSSTEPTSLKILLNNFAKTISLLYSNNLINENLANLVKPIEGDFDLDENLLNSLNKINDVVGDYSTIFKFEDSSCDRDLLIKMDNGVDIKKYNVKNNDIMFSSIIGKEYMLPYLDFTESSEMVAVNMENEKHYVTDIVCSFPLRLIRDYFKLLLSKITKENALQTANTCRLINDKVLACSQISSLLEDSDNLLNPVIVERIIDFITRADMMGQLGNNSNGPMNFF